MRTHLLTSRLSLPLSADTVFAFFSEAANLERITPKELRFRIVTPQPVIIGAGSIIDYTLTLYGLRFRWRTLIPVWEPPLRFVDEQLRGPYALWRHTHTFTPTAEGTEIGDRVEYALPLHPLSAPGIPLVRAQVRRIFEHRQRAVIAAFGVPEEHCRWEVHA
jgi:ligand-binding SRPBCC domain-containing protein